MLTVLVAMLVASAGTELLAAASAVAGNPLTEWAIAVAALVTALAVIWRKALHPLIVWVRKLKQWMTGVEEALDYVQREMQFNGGSTLRDESRQTRDLLAEHLTRYAADRDALAARLTEAAVSRAAMYERIETLEDHLITDTQGDHHDR